MTKKTFEQGMTDLQEAFNYEMSEGQIKVYWKYLKDTADERFPQVVEHLLFTEQRFPTIATIRDCPFFDWERK